MDSLEKIVLSTSFGVFLLELCRCIRTFSEPAIPIYQNKFLEGGNYIRSNESAESYKPNNGPRVEGLGTRTCGVHQYRRSV